MISIIGIKILEMSLDIIVFFVVVNFVKGTWSQVQSVTFWYSIQDIVYVHGKG